MIDLYKMKIRIIDLFNLRNVGSKCFNFLSAVVLYILLDIPFVNEKGVFFQESNMLNRYQVLLPDWLEEYIKIGVEAYGFSFSEIIRLQVCFTTLTQILELHPEYTPKLTPKDLLGVTKEATTQQVDKKSIDRFVSQFYFETRKAIEYRMQKIEEKSKG